MAAADPDFQASQSTFCWREPFEIDPGTAVVGALRQAAAQVLPEPPPLGEAFWMDSAILAAAGIETVIFGPSGGGAHAAVEWVELDSVMRIAQVPAQAARQFCGD